MDDFCKTKSWSSLILDFPSCLQPGVQQTGTPGTKCVKQTGCSWRIQSRPGINAVRLLPFPETAQGCSRAGDQEVGSALNHPPGSWSRDPVPEGRAGAGGVHLDR